MKWVTRDHVHLDRVASPWLIRRYIDSQAEFGFVDWDHDGVLPAGTVAYALPGAEVGPHDAEGSTFRKLLRHYGVQHPALELMADIIESGVQWVFHRDEPGFSCARLKEPAGVGLDAIAHGMMFAAASDADNLDRSMPLYDALFQYCRVRLLLQERPDLADFRRHPPPACWDLVQEALASRP